ncbi:MAG: nitroreductase family protein [Bacillota bacterium]
MSSQFLTEAIKNRRSIRKYQDREVPSELITKALQLASYAPNGGNFQPWHFVVVKNQELKSKMARLVQEKVDIMVSWPEVGDDIETLRRHQKNISFFKDAPICIVAFAKEYQSAADKVLRKRAKIDPYAQEMISNRESAKSSVQAVAAAIMNFLLVVHSYGLGACWMAGPLLAKREIEELLGVKDMNLIAVIPVGYPAEEGTFKERKKVGEFVTFIE